MVLRREIGADGQQKSFELVRWQGGAEVLQDQFYFRTRQDPKGHDRRRDDGEAAALRFAVDGLRLAVPLLAVVSPSNTVAPPSFGGRRLLRAPFRLDVDYISSSRRGVTVEWWYGREAGQEPGRCGEPQPVNGKSEGRSLSVIASSVMALGVLPGAEIKLILENLCASLPPDEFKAFL